MGIGTASQIIALKSPSHAGDTRLTDMVALAKLNLSSAVFGVRYEYAVALLVLHWLTLDAMGGGTSTTSGGGTLGVKSEKEGELSRAYFDPKSSEGESYYAQTAFGNEFLQLRKSQIVLPMNRFVT